jgi:SNF2 family DNA or RNA helicase
MSTASVEAAPLYRSPSGLFDFQAEAVARAYLGFEEGRDALSIFDTGLGKTHLAMASAALRFEDDLADLVLVVCEKAKITDWMEDFATFTGLTAVAYAGTPKKRERIREGLSGVHVLVTTYETARNDGAVFASNKRKAPTPGPLLDVLSGQRVLVVYDEVTKLKTRTSLNYRAHSLLLSTMRETGSCDVLGLTATPVEKNIEDYFNIARLHRGTRFTTVAAFESDHCVYRDQFGNWAKFKNLDADTTYEHGVVSFVDKIRPIVLRKRKTDPDVIDQFPKQVEEFTYVTLDPKHRAFIESVEHAYIDCKPEEERALFTVKRQIVAHPASLTLSEGKIARDIVAQVGEAGLWALGSAKTDRLIEYLEPLVKGQGAQAVVFTFFGQSVLPLLARALTDAGFTVTLNHGGMTSKARAESQAAFKAGGAEIFLSSDAGSRGLNLQEANYVIHYELALTFALHTQRTNRNHRIDSTNTSVTSMGFIARDTIEEVVSRLVLNRNVWSDLALEDRLAEGTKFVSAQDRKALLAAARAASTREDIP